MTIGSGLLGRLYTVPGMVREPTPISEATRSVNGWTAGLAASEGLLARVGPAARRTIQSELAMRAIVRRGDLLAAGGAPRVHASVSSEAPNQFRGFTESELDIIVDALMESREAGK